MSRALQHGGLDRMQKVDSPPEFHLRRNEEESGDLVGLNYPHRGCHRFSFFCSRRLWCRPCLPQRPNSSVRGRFDATHRPKTIFKAVWWTKGITKARPDIKPNQNHRHPRRSEAQSGDLLVLVRHRVPDRLAPSGMTARPDKKPNQNHRHPRRSEAQSGDPVTQMHTWGK